MQTLPEYLTKRYLAWQADEHGLSNALSKSLSALEEEEHQLTAQLLELKQQSTTPILIPTAEQARRYARHIRQQLHTQDPITTRQTLLGLIHEIPTDRTSNTLISRIIYFHTPLKKKPLSDTVSINRPPVGALIYRHSIPLIATIPKSGRPRKGSK